MKFTNEQALESLRRELTNNGRKPLRMSEKTLTKVTEALLPKFADDETGLPDFIESALVILNPINDNIQKDRSDFIKSWKAEHPETDGGEGDGEGTTANSGAASLSPELAALKAEIEALKKASAEAESQRKLTATKSALTAKLKEKGITDSEWLDLMLSKVNIGEELDVEAEADDLLKLYNKKEAAVSGSQTPGQSSGKPSGEVPEALKRVKDLFQKEKDVAKIFK